ncbi:MAG: flagellar basal body rod protein FlgB [Gammaproteobacteria bacterium]|nr:flagellar basal body rod protein FlgB [Gammaproteobacteria bacterium]
MKIGIDNALGMHPQALSLRANRTQVLAQNIANADTPGYKARDIDFQSILQRVSDAATPSATRMRLTHESHMTQGQVSMGGPDDLKYRVPQMPSLEGNTVEAQVEQAEFAKNSMQFLASLRFVNGRLSGLMSAIKGE